MMFLPHSPLLAVNTRIGWPWEYWHDGQALAMYVLVCALVCTSVSKLSLLAQDRCDSRLRELIFTLCRLILASGLLQLLPATESGIQILPISPGAFSSWIAWGLSLIAWVFFALTLWALVMPFIDKHCGAAFFLLTGLAVNAVLSIWTPHGVLEVTNRTEIVEVNSPMDAKLTQQIENWKEKESAIEESLRSLRSDRRDLVEKLRQIGVRSNEDISRNAAARELAEELRSLIRQIADTEAMRQRLEAAITVLESRRRRLKQQQQAQMVGAISEVEIERLRLAGLESIDNLRHTSRSPAVVSDLELDSVIKTELGSGQSSH